jgi:hypothetical protein
MSSALLLGVVLFAGAVVWLPTIGLPWVRDFARAPGWQKAVHAAWQVALFGWFARWAWYTVHKQFILGGKLAVDAHIYYRGAHAWVNGLDPWNAVASSADYRFHFAAPPPSVILFAPFTPIPEQVFATGFMMLSIAAAFYILRRVHLPAWWIAFPPLLIGALSGNPVVIGVACALTGSRWLAPIGVAAKIYVGGGMLAERRWMALAVTAFVMLATVILFWPLWHQYLVDYSSISSTIGAESIGGYSATRSIPLFVVTAAMMAILAVIDFRAACWLAVPALAPFTEFHASIFALPVMSPILAIGLSYPRQGLAPIVICVYVGWRILLATPLLEILPLPNGVLKTLGRGQPPSHMPDQTSS